MKLAVIVALCALVPAAPALAKKPPPPAPAPAQVGGPSRAVTQDILDAIAEEMNRAMTKLQIDGAPRPYSISYKITEVDVNDVAASFGYTTSRRNRHFVSLEARVRVGSADFDNGNFVVPEAPEIDGMFTINLPLEATPRIARRAAWLVTDTAYKEALVQLRAKLEARKAGSLPSTGVPAWTTEKPVVGDDPVLVAPLESLDELETRAKAISSVFRDQPALRDARVSMTSYLERRWYLTTEGTSVTDTRRATGIVIDAAGLASDGQLLHQYLLRYGRTAKDLPSDDELEAESKKLAEGVVQLAKAPVFEAYSGPVLFEGEGAVGLVRFSLAPNLGGTPVPEGLNPQDAKQFGGAFAGKIGLRPLSPQLSIVDDPTVSVGAGKSLIGGYKIDDEGVAAQRVQVVKDGTLKALLTSRTPSERGQSSNGHARCSVEGGAFHGCATNLFVSAKGSVPRAQLERQLIAAARSENLKYGLIIRQLDDAAITAAPEFSRRELVQMYKTTDPQLPPPALVAYRLYPNGKRELVRGVQLTDLPISIWKNVIGTSKELTAYNFLVATEPQLALRLSGGTDDGYVPSGGFESAIVTPDLLIKDVDVVGSSGGARSQPIVPKPTK